MRALRSSLQFALAGTALALASFRSMEAQSVDVQVRVELLQQHGSRGVDGKAQKPLDHGDLVVWLSPQPQTDPVVMPGHFRMEQKNKSFSPHLLVVPLGSTVEFPNLDPFFHNVFSQFNGKRFDLGLYEAGSTRVVHFDHEGVSFLFCNIHSQMAAVIVTLRSPYFAVASRSGPLQLHNVPSGDYELHVWAEGADPKALQELSRRVHISESQQDLGTMKVYVTVNPGPHKNKFGEDYRPEPEQSY